MQHCLPAKPFALLLPWYCSIGLISSPILYSSSSFANNTQLRCQAANTEDGQQTLLLDCQPLANPKPANNNTDSTPVHHPEQQPEAHVDNKADAANPTIGEAPITEDISRLFLRDSEVLLKPKEIEVTLGFNYAKNDRAQNLRLSKGRTISLPVGVSIGISDKMELSASVPLLYVEQEFVTFGDANKNENSGLGDLNLGLSYQLFKENSTRPSLTASLSYTLATGEDGDQSDPESIGLSAGFENLGASFSLTKSIDPAVLFVVLGYSHSFREEQQGLTTQPGDTFTYSLGTGFAINNQLSLSWQLNGAYSEETRVDGNKFIGSSSEPVSLTAGNTYQISNKKRLQTRVGWGLNDEAEDLSISIIYGVTF